MTASLLPQAILHPSMPIGKADENGDVLVEQNWWLLFYNLCQAVLGIGAGGPTGVTGLSAASLIELNSLDADASDADAVVLRSPIANLQLIMGIEPQTDADIAIARNLALQGLLWAQDTLLPDPQAAAQPVQVLTVGASPYSYTLPFTGNVAVTGGVISTIALIRQGTTVATGLTTGLIPASRGDVVQVTYTAAPAMTFLPL